jgi:hypothetical protein
MAASIPVKEEINETQEEKPVPEPQITTPPRLPAITSSNSDDNNNNDNNNSNSNNNNNNTNGNRGSTGSNSSSEGGMENMTFEFGFQETKKKVYLRRTVRKRLIWTNELNGYFIQAIKRLGINGR